MTLRRRNSIATSVLLPCHLTLPRPLSSSFTATATATSSSSSSATSSSSSSSSADFPTKPTIPSYTSLKDLIPAATAASVQSPTAAAASAGGEIPIRNRLVKQAAWAYLQPMSTSQDSAADNLFRRVLRTPLFSLLRAVARALKHAFCFCFL